MRSSVKYIWILTLMAGWSYPIFAVAAASDSIVIENSEMRLVIGSDGKALSLVSGGQECLVSGVNIPAFSLTQYRPYDNELQLKYPATQKTFSADSVILDGDHLVVQFELINIEATIALKITGSYIAFTLEKLGYRIPEYGDKRKTPADELVFLQLPVKDRDHFGEWLNVVWDDDLAVNLLGADPAVKIDAQACDGYHLLTATAVSEVKGTDVTAVLIASPEKTLLDRIDRVEQDFNLPRGVQSRRSDAYKYSYYEVWDATPENIDEHIAFAKEGGFRAIQIVWTAFAKSIGHFEWNEEYPGGMKDLQVVIGKIKDAGMIAGAHFWYNKTQKTDPYVTPVPDYRLNIRRSFTLASALDTASTVIEVEENPAGCTLDEDRRFLMIGRELIEYSDYSTDRPFTFTGCTRGALETRPSGYDRGSRFGILDVDTWPIWIRFDQRTSIQQEVARRIGSIYNEAGFDFVYFDGAEDVPPPYWFNVAMSQEIVYRELSPPPAFSEGALKSHFNWHILTRGNAFDVFSPEVIKEATRMHPVDEMNFIYQDFTSINFGWINYTSPGENTTGIQPDMLEYVCSRAAAWDCPISLEGRLEALRSHPRTPDNLEVIRRWEDARINNILTPAQKQSMRNTTQEHILLVNGKGEPEWHPYDRIPGAAVGDPRIRAFIFERSGRTCVVYWNTSGEGKLALNLEGGKTQLFKQFGKPLKMKRDGKTIILPFAGRFYLETDLDRETVNAAFRKAKLL